MVDGRSRWGGSAKQVRKKRASRFTYFLLGTSSFVYCNCRKIFMMLVLPEAFRLATSLGIWEPLVWKSDLAKFFYKVYSCISFTVIIFMMVLQVIATLFFTKNIDDFTEATYMLLSTINASVKGATILLRRKYVIDLADALLVNMCLPQSAVERKIALYFGKISRYTVILCIVLAEATVSILAALPILFYRGQFILPLRAWYPYDVGSGMAYCLAYLHQTAALLLIAAYDVASDTIITGFMLQICAQLDLMTARLKNMSLIIAEAISNNAPTEAIRVFEKNFIVQGIQHHLFIFRFAEDINFIFAPVILVQFCLSSIVLCVTIYQLTASKSNGIEIIGLILYLTSMLVELFIYCWFGNEVTIKSLACASAIYQMNWINLRFKTIRDLVIIMIRSTSPILLSCGPLITLSLESFTKILKISYSAFNVLHR